MHSKCIGLRPRRFESCRCRFASFFFYCYLSFGAHHAFVLLSGQVETGEGAECRLSRVCGVVVSHPLRMRRVPGSNPGESILLLPLCGQIPVSDRLFAAPRRAAPEPATSNNNASPGPWFSDPLRLCTKKCPNQDLNLGCRGHNATS